MTDAAETSTRRTFWPYGLSIAIALFMVIMIGLVVYLSVSHRQELVTPDYYRQEVQYQQHIDRVARTEAAGGAALRLSGDQRHLLVSLPEDHRGKPVTGTIHLYRASDARQDRVDTLAVDASGNQSVDVASLSEGYWTAKVSWELDGQEYYQQLDFILNRKGSSP